MNRMHGIIFRKLKGKGADVILDVGKIVHIRNRKRLFCLTDKDKPYVIEIEYHDPKNEMTIYPVIGGTGGVSLSSYYRPTRWISSRYNKEDMDDDIEQIRKDMLKLDGLNEKICSW